MGVVRTAAALESELRRSRMEDELRWSAFSFAMQCTGGDVGRAIALAKQVTEPNPASIAEEG